MIIADAAITWFSNPTLIKSKKMEDYVQEFTPNCLMCGGLDIERRQNPIQHSVMKQGEPYSHPVQQMPIIILCVWEKLLICELAKENHINRMSCVHIQAQKGVSP